MSLIQSAHQAKRPVQEQGQDRPPLPPLGAGHTECVEGRPHGGLATFSGMFGGEAIENVVSWTIWREYSLESRVTYFQIQRWPKSGLQSGLHDPHSPGPSLWPDWAGGRVAPPSSCSNALPAPAGSSAGSPVREQPGAWPGRALNRPEGSRAFSRPRLAQEGLCFHNGEEQHRGPKEDWHHRGPPQVTGGEGISELSQPQKSSGPQPLLGLRQLLRKSPPCPGNQQGCQKALQETPPHCPHLEGLGEAGTGCGTPVPQGRMWPGSSESLGRAW